MKLLLLLKESYCCSSIHFPLGIVQMTGMLSGKKRFRHVGVDEAKNWPTVVAEMWEWLLLAVLLQI